ncbi:hypothetical protein LTR16_009873, partial [Cryomyces antarcticus]
SSSRAATAMRRPTTPSRLVVRATTLPRSAPVPSTLRPTTLVPSSSPAHTTRLSAPPTLLLRPPTTRPTRTLAAVATFLATCLTLTWSRRTVSLRVLTAHCTTLLLTQAGARTRAAGLDRTTSASRPAGHTLYPSRRVAPTS